MEYRVSRLLISIRARLYEADLQENHTRDARIFHRFSRGFSSIGAVKVCICIVRLTIVNKQRLNLPTLQSINPLEKK